MLQSQALIANSQRTGAYNESSQREHELELIQHSDSGPGHKLTYDQYD